MKLITKFLTGVLCFVLNWSQAQFTCSSMQYNLAQFEQNTDQRDALLNLESDWKRVRKFTAPDSSIRSANILVYNHTNLSFNDFVTHCQNLLSALNRDFGSHPLANPNDTTYNHLIHNPFIDFSFGESQNFEATYSDKWSDWNGFKSQNSDPDAIKIWVIDTPDDIGSYASAPLDKDDHEGIVIDLEHFILDDTSYAEGKIFTYLIGEYLGLKSLDNNGTCADDGVLDTPRHENLISACLPSKFNSACDQRPIMMMNFMCQSHDSCKSMFTKGQVARMQYFIDNANSLNSKFSKS